MSVLHKKSARLRDEERARLIWLLSTDKAVTSALLGKLTLAERYDEGTLADDLAEKLPCPVRMWDERSTTVTATQYLNMTDVRGKKRKNTIDAVAATIILESYLAYRKNHPGED